MQIEFDPDKDAINRAKHRMSLEAAADMDLLQAAVVEDTRFDYGERRFLVYGRIGGRLHVLWFTRRGATIRVIGLRKANGRERKCYDQGV